MKILKVYSVCFSTGLTLLRESFWFLSVKITNEYEVFKFYKRQTYVNNYKQYYQIKITYV